MVIFHGCVNYELGYPSLYEYRQYRHMICMCLYTHRIHGAAIYGNMDPINIPPLCLYIYTSTMDPLRGIYNKVNG